MAKAKFERTKPHVNIFCYFAIPFIFLFLYAPQDEANWVYC